MKTKLTDFLTKQKPDRVRWKFRLRERVFYTGYFYSKDETTWRPCRILNRAVDLVGGQQYFIRGISGEDFHGWVWEKDLTF